jgi:hypothetical protein
MDKYAWFNSTERIGFYSMVDLLPKYNSNMMQCALQEADTRQKISSDLEKGDANEAAGRICLDLT